MGAICVVARTKHLCDRYADALKDADIPTLTLDADSSDNEQTDGVRIATLHRVKGLEFQYMFLAGINQGVVPQPYTRQSADPVELRDNEFNERALLHVAATRAVKGLYVSCSGAPSVFLEP
nr:3'-5' exonuclease [Oceanisphaera litoralis]